VRIVNLCVMAVSVFSISCVRQAPGNHDQWSYEKGAIELQLSADQRLNLYNERSHSLHMCIYHLRDLNGFNQLMDEREGLVKLLECSRFDPGVAYVKRFVIQPGQVLRETMDRSEGARYLGVVTGYYALSKHAAVRSVQIPQSLFHNPKKLMISLELGPQGIKEFAEQ
jgi:type VI secretion system VasD/TssJ family lipoprotein